VAFADGEVVE